MRLTLELAQVWPHAAEEEEVERIGEGWVAQKVDLDLFLFASALLCKRYAKKGGIYLAPPSPYHSMELTMQSLKYCNLHWQLHIAPVCTGVICQPLAVSAAVRQLVNVVPKQKTSERAGVFVYVICLLFPFLLIGLIAHRSLRRRRLLFCLRFKESPKRLAKQIRNTRVFWFLKAASVPLRRMVGQVLLNIRRKKLKNLELEKTCFFPANI